MVEQAVVLVDIVVIALLAVLKLVAVGLWEVDILDPALMMYH